MFSFQCSQCGKNALRKFVCRNCGNDDSNEADHDILFKDDGTAILSDTGTCPSHLDCPECGGRLFSQASMSLCMSCFRNLKVSEEK